MTDVVTQVISPDEIELSLRVRYCECDPQNVAHHSAYIPWLEIARTELLRTKGVAYADMEKAGVFFVVAKLAVRYRRAARYDDVIRLRVRQTHGTRVKVDHDYQVFRGDELLCEAETTLVCVGADGRPQAIPEQLGV